MDLINSMLQNEYMCAALIMAASILLAHITRYILNNYIKGMAAKTKTEVDDTIIEVIAKPLYFLIFFIGLYSALKSLTIFAGYTFWIGRVTFISAVLIIALICSKVLSALIAHWLEVGKRFEKTPRLINRIVSVTIFILAFLIILKKFNVAITPLVATLGIGGLAIGLALQSTLSNFFAGLHIISDQSYNVGDFIEINERNVSGYIADIGWRTTKINALNNKVVVVPNSKLSESIVINDSLPRDEVSFSVLCGVAYNSDLKKVEQVTIDVARKIQNTTMGAVKNFEPAVRYHSFTETKINFNVGMKAEKFEDKFLIAHELIKALSERYQSENIVIGQTAPTVLQNNRV